MKEVGTKDLRQFGAVLAGILAVFGVIHFLKGHVSVYPWFFAFAGGTLLFVIFLPVALKPVYAVFIRIAHGLGWFNTRVILILIYYFLLTPIGLIMRVFQKDPLDRKIEKHAGSCWIKRDHCAASTESLERQF